MHSGEPLIDDRRFVAWRSVGILKRAPANDPNAERLEVPRADADHGDDRRTFVRFRPAFDCELTAEAAAPGPVAGRRGGVERANGGEPLVDATDEDRKSVV